MVSRWEATSLVRGSRPNLPTFDLSTHDPARKDGVRLTRLGYEAIVYAFDEGLDADQIAALFKIGRNNAYAYRKRWLGEMPWPYGRAPRNWFSAPRTRRANQSHG